MAAAVVILFWKTGESARQIVVTRDPFHIAALLLFGIAPVLNFVSDWIPYTGNGSRATIFLSDRVFARLPAGIAGYARVEIPELHSIDIAKWSEGELHVPPYPEDRIYKSMAKKICGYADNPTEVRLSIVSRSTVGKTITGASYTCAALDK